MTGRKWVRKMRLGDYLDAVRQAVGWKVGDQIRLLWWRLKSLGLRVLSHTKGLHNKDK